MARTWDRPAYVPPGSERLGVVGSLAFAAGPVSARGARAGCRCRRAGSKSPRRPGEGRPGRGRWEMGCGRRSSSSPWPSMIWTGQLPSAVTARLAGRGHRRAGGRLGRDRCGPEQERGASADRHGADHDRPHRRYHRGHGTGPAVTGIWAGCVAIARPYALGILGTTRHDARGSGTAGLRFRTIAVIPGPSRHERKSTANAVGRQHPPGFKSPILRSDQQLRPSTPTSAGCCLPLSGALAWPPPQSGRPFGSSATRASVTERHPQMHAHAVMGGRHRTAKRFVVSAPGAWLWPRARTLIAERGQPSGGNRARSRRYALTSA